MLICNNYLWKHAWDGRNLMNKVDSIRAKGRKQTRLVTFLANRNRKPPNIQVNNAMVNKVDLFGLPKSDAIFLEPFITRYISVSVNNFDKDHEARVTLTRIFDSFPLEYAKKQ